MGFRGLVRSGSAPAPLYIIIAYAIHSRYLSLRTMTAYQSISVADEESAQHPSASSPKRNDHCVRLMVVIGIVVLALITTSLRALSGQNNDDKDKGTAVDQYSSTTTSSIKVHSRRTNVPMPTGVNLGSWVRENYIFYYFLFNENLCTPSPSLTLSYVHNSCPSKIGSTSVTMAQ